MTGLKQNSALSNFHSVKFSETAIYSHLRRYTNSPNTIGNAWGSQLMRLPASYMF